MAYTTPAAVRAYFSVTIADYPDDVINPLIAGADEIVDGYLAKSFSVPLSEPVDALIELASKKLACSEFYPILWGNNPPEGAEEIRANIYKEAINLLKDIISGDLQITVATKEDVFTGADGSHVELDEEGEYYSTIEDDVLE